jgi:hypothetical protein
LSFIVFPLRIDVIVNVLVVFRVAMMSGRELFGVFALVRVDAATASGSLGRAKFDVGESQATTVTPLTTLPPNPPS